MSLHNDWTFEAFLRTQCASAGYRLCRSIADDRPGAPRVLLLHGPTGIGKTHLLHAIGHARAHGTPAARIRVTSANQLTRELTFAIREDRIREVQSRPLDIDILIVDDLHQLVEKRGTRSVLGATLALG